MTPGGLPRLELYGTIAQAYRPRTYGELVSTAPDGVVNGDLTEGNSLQFELGIRGKPLPYLTFDVGGFYFVVDDQVGEITGVNAMGNTFTTTQNVGDARYAGFEATTELDILAMINGGTESPYGQFNLILGNEVVWIPNSPGGPTEGFDTTYAPDYQVSRGIYRWKDRVKVGLLGNLVGSSFADANNTPDHFIPAYAVWDLTAEVNFCKGRVGVFAGINNLFNEDFYAEIRDEAHRAGAKAELLRRLEDPVLETKPRIRERGSYEPPRPHWTPAREELRVIPNRCPPPARSAFFRKRDRLTEFAFALPTT
jgi:outer membrane receptor protein involved in Fe transport